MNETEAIHLHDRFRLSLESDFNNPVARAWVNSNLQRPESELCSDGSWIFVYKTDPDPAIQGKPLEAIIVRPDGNLT